MAINQKQVLSLQQKLSPQQIQMIKLLELPAVQLEQRIKQEIEDNIVLEEEERSAEDEEQPPQQISFDEYLREDDTPSYKSRINNFSKDDKQRPVYLTEGRSLQEYLVEQLGYRNLPERDLRLAVYLIGSIDEDGYLRRDLESVADDIAFTMGLETTAGELERLLGIIHELEPAGIGARDLRECLLLQMAQMPVNTRPRRRASTSDATTAGRCWPDSAAVSPCPSSRCFFCKSSRKNENRPETVSGRFFVVVPPVRRSPGRAWRWRPS